MAEAFHAFISGKVQGVAFRAATADKAKELGVEGWARNLADGRVEVLASGEADALAEFQDWLWMGPPAARVDGVDAHPIDPDEVPTGFQVR